MFLTNIIIIICIVISIVASSTTAQLGNWEILFQSLETDFQNTMTDKIILKYKVGSGRNFIVELLDKNCAVAISGNVFAPTATIARTTGATTNHDEVEIKLTWEKSTIASLDIWEDNSLQFCVRIRILSGGSIIKEE
jgi:hypothetical protein